MDESELAAAVKAYAVEIGLELAGVVSVDVLDALPRTWVGWTIRSYTERIREHLPEARSVVMLGCHVWDDILEAAVRRGEGWHYPGYWALSARARDVAIFLERQGYRAYLGGPLVSWKQAARLAGLGTYGKNALLVTPDFGPWVRLAAVITDAPMAHDIPFEDDLCGDCEACLAACPVGALTPYTVDPDRCLVGVHLGPEAARADEALLARYESQITPLAHLMCTACQKACPLGPSDSPRRLG
jgi:epoxyqueuosine reductase QueG